METVKVINLRALRLQKGLRVKELSALSGISRTSITKYESCKRRITRRSQVALCTALGVDENTDLEKIIQIDKHWASKTAKEVDESMLPKGKRYNV